MQSTYATHQQSTTRGGQQPLVQVPITYQDNREQDQQYLQRVQNLLDEQTGDGRQVLNIYEAQFLADLEYGEANYPVPEPSYKDTTPLGNPALEQTLTRLAQTEHTAQDVTDLYVTFARKTSEDDTFVPREQGPWDQHHLALADEHDVEGVVENYLEFTEHDQYREQEDTMPVVRTEDMTVSNQITMFGDDTFLFYWDDGFYKNAQDDA